MTDPPAARVIRTPDQRLRAFVSAAVSLARLWLAQGRAGRAHQLLSEARSRLADASDSADLREADALLGAT